MKRLLFLISAIIFLFSCNPQPDNVIHATIVDSTHAGWKYDSTLGKPVLIQESFYQVAPTWGQAHDWAYRSGQLPWSLLGLGLLACAAFLIYKKMQDTNVSPWLIFTCLVLSLASFESKPAFIKYNNYKKITVEEYKFQTGLTGSISAFWAKQYQENKILGAGH